MENDSPSATLEPPVLGLAEGLAAAPTVYLSARGQDTALVAAVVKTRLESQGCVVRHGAAEVRTRSQCARHYGPLLHDCDVFIQIIGVDPGPVLSSEDGDDDFWSLQVWEAREAAKRRKPARHYLLNDDFCRAMFPETDRPAHVLKKQARHRRKLASSPSKVRQVRDTDELLSLLPIIRLTGSSVENPLPAAAASASLEPDAVPKFASDLVPVMGTNGCAPVLDALPEIPTAIGVSEGASEPTLAAETKNEEPPAFQTSVVPEFRMEPPSAAFASPMTTTAVVPASVAPEAELSPEAATAPLPTESHVTPPPLPALPSLPEIADSLVTPLAADDSSADLAGTCEPSEALLGVSLTEALPMLPEADAQITPGESIPPVEEMAPVIPPIPALPSTSEPDPAPGSVTDAGSKDTLLCDAQLPGTAELEISTKEVFSGTPVPEVAVQEVSLPPTSATHPVTEDDVRQSPAADSPQTVSLLAPPSEEASDSVPEKSSGQEHAITGTAELLKETDGQPLGEQFVAEKLQNSSSDQFPASLEAATTANVNPESEKDSPALPGSPLPAEQVVAEKEVSRGEEEPSVTQKESMPQEPTIVLKEKNQIEVRPARAEIVAQAPMKLELCRAEGYRVSARPYALERRGLPRRGLPSWMLKRSEDHNSPVRPIPGRRAYVTAAKTEDGAPKEEEEDPSFLQTLILPDAPPLRKYLRRTFFVFRLTDSVTVRRLSEATRRKPGMAIATGVGVVVLAGLLIKVSTDFFVPGSIVAQDLSNPSNPALAAPSRMDVSTVSPKRKANAVQQPALVSPKATPPSSTPLTSQSKPLPATTTAPSPAPVSAKAGSVAKPAPQSTVPGPQRPGPSASLAGGNVDEQQRLLEKELEETILARRKSGASVQVYARDHESEILDLQRRIQEFIPIRRGHGSSGSAQALSLSRCLASIHLLGGRNQAARNVLLDARDAIALSHSEGDPELRLTDYLLTLVNLASTPNQTLPARVQIPLTPEEMEALLSRFDSNPQWEPLASGEVVSDAK